MRDRLLILALVLLIRLPFLNHPIQGDDAYYLAFAQHAQIEPLHPANFKHIATGITVDMRGYPHPPFNGWYLGLLLALLGDIHELPFHLAYLPFSFIAALAAYSIARKLSTAPLWATLLFIATPAFVINGTSLESDLPHLAFFLAAIACFLNGRLLPAAVAMILATLTAYQAVLLIPILAFHLYRERDFTLRRWLVLLTPALVFVAYQAFERLTTGALPAAVLNGYFSAYALQSLLNKIRNAVALTTHLGWMVSPLLAPLSWISIPAALAAAWWDVSPLFWLPFSLGLATLLHGRRLPWLLIFFGGALIIFFAGSARYLLPIALPVAILAAERYAGRLRLLAAGFATHLALALTLAAANYQQWSRYRDLALDPANKATWVNAEWGLRFYAESLGALPMLRGQPVRPSQSVLASELSFPVPYATGGGMPVTVQRYFIAPALPFRLFALNSQSGYSSAGHGFRAFDLSTQPADVITLTAIREQAPELSFLPVNAPQAASQIISGAHALESNSWRWTAARTVVLLKSPAAPTTLTATFRIVDQSPARHVTLSLDGAIIAQGDYPGPGLYKLTSQTPLAPTNPTATVVLTADRSPRALAGISERIKSRLSGGLEADVHPTDFELHALGSFNEATGEIIPHKEVIARAEDHTS